jgi:hypothetical protein
VPHLPLLRFPVWLRVGKHARLELSASDVISVRHLAGLGEKPSEWGYDALTAVDRLGAYPWFRRLPSHGRSPFRSCPHLVFLSYELFIWYNDPLVERTGTKHTGLSPDKITPMLGVLADEALDEPL